MRTFLICVLFMVGCGKAEVIKPESCVVVENDENTFTMLCPDGTSVTWRNGEDGIDADSAFQGDGTIHGNFEVKNNVDAAILRYYSVIEGDLIINYSTSLPTIMRIEGWMFINGDQVKFVEIPELRYANNVQIYNTNITDLNNIGTSETIIDEYLIIIHNQNLDQCHAEDWANSITANGIIDISGNNPC